MNSPSRILIIRLSSLGDILHTLPAFGSLRASFPNAKIGWLAAHKTKFLLSAVRGIDSLHVLNTSHLLSMPPDRQAWGQLRQLIREIRAQHYDVAIDFQGLLKTSILCALSGAALRLGFSRELVRERPAHWFYRRTLKRPQHQVHVSELNQMLAELSGACRVPYRPDFQTSEADQAFIDSLLRQNPIEDFIVINPGGGWPTKRWAPDKYGALAERINTELHLPVVVTTGPGEEPLYRTIAECSGTAVVHHYPVSFLQMIPLLQKTSLCVGGDTGPFHLACALNVPVVGIFGPTSPLRNGPWREGEEVVSHDLPCGPCHARSCSKGAECMNISVNEVFEAVGRRLTNARREVSVARF